MRAITRLRQEHPCTDLWLCVDSLLVSKEGPADGLGNVIDGAPAAAIHMIGVDLDATVAVRNIAIAANSAGMTRVLAKRIGLPPAVAAPSAVVMGGCHSAWPATPSWGESSSRRARLSMPGQGRSNTRGASPPQDREHQCYRQQ